VSVEKWLVHSLAGVARGHAVDIGANVGSWTHLLAGEFSSVTAVEADGRAYEVLSAGLPGNAVAIYGAACSVNGDVLLYSRPSSEQSSLLEVHPIGAAGCAHAPVRDVVTVHGFTLDALCPHGADFIKIDIEGAEVDVLAVASAGVWSRATFLVECHATFDQVVKELMRLGKDVERVPHPHSDAHPDHCWAVGRPADA
jgi:FkbM family methyltransferase